jgi:hypothetical protein
MKRHQKAPPRRSSPFVSPFNEKNDFAKTTRLPSNGRDHSSLLSLVASQTQPQKVRGSEDRGSQHLD